jgi:peroxiredoxin-like protein
MQEFPHHYAVTAKAEPQSIVNLTSPGVAVMESAPPAEFGGPGNLWSPETLLVAAVADCFILSFRAIARASRFDWLSLQCDVDGILERPEQVTQFTEFRLRVVLEVSQGTDPDKAKKLLEKAEHSCLITNSLKALSQLNMNVIVIE